MIIGLPSVNAAVNGVPDGSSLKSGIHLGPGHAAGNGSSPFGDLFKEAVDKVNQLEEQAHTAVNGLMTGTGVDVHEAAIASEKASMAFEMVLALRNKAIQSYQSVMSMQF